jgi:hypothetical protein
VRMTAASPTGQGSSGKTLNDASRVRRRPARSFQDKVTFYSVAARTAFGVRGRVAVTVVPWPGREWTCQLPPAISSC